MDGHFCCGDGWVYIFYGESAVEDADVLSGDG